MHDLPAVERQVYTIKEVGRILGVNRNLAYELARTGQIPTIRLGKRLVCPKQALNRMLAEAGFNVPTTEE